MIDLRISLLDSNKDNICIYQIIKLHSNTNIIIIRSNLLVISCFGRIVEISPFILKCNSPKEVSKVDITIKYEYLDSDKNVNYLWEIIFVFQVKIESTTTIYY